MGDFNLGLLKVDRQTRTGVDSKTATQRFARVLRETRGFPGKVRLVARLGQITFRAAGQMVVPANKPHPYSTMEQIVRDRCTPRFVTITDETETKMAHEALTDLVAEGYTPQAQEVYELKVWDEASHFPLSVHLERQSDDGFVLKDAFMVANKKLICDYLFPTEQPDVRICLDTQRKVDESDALLDFVRHIRVHTSRNKSESESESNDCVNEELTFSPAGKDGKDEKKDVEEGEGGCDEHQSAEAHKQRFHAFFLRKKNDVLYRLNQDCFVRTSRVSETGFGSDERNRKWETEIEFITTGLPQELDSEGDNTLEARLEDFFGQVLKVRQELHRRS